MQDRERDSVRKRWKLIPTRAALPETWYAVSSQSVEKLSWREHAQKPDGPWVSCI